MAEAHGVIPWLMLSPSQLAAAGPHAAEQTHYDE
jgi:hypothetical protein